MLKVMGPLVRFVSAPDYERVGVGYAPGGPQDRFSCRLANRLLGNDEYAGAIEITHFHAEISFEQDAAIVVGGAPSEILLDEQPVSDWTMTPVKAGSKLRVSVLPLGCRVYLCVAGGLVETDTEGCFRKRGNGEPEGFRAIDGLTLWNRWAPASGTVRVLPGPEFSDEARTILGPRLRIDANSSGMGLRLSGSPLTLPSFDIVSSPVTDGTVQATPTGLIALLRERGTIGGYPRVLTVIDSDVDQLAQFRIGQEIRFELVDFDEAIAISEQQRNALESVR